MAIPDANRSIGPRTGNQRCVIIEYHCDYGTTVTKKADLLPLGTDLSRSGINLQNVYMPRLVANRDAFATR